MTLNPQEKEGNISSESAEADNFMPISVAGMKERE
jgi:hypothetical protein